MIPQALHSAWSACTPTDDVPLRDQLLPLEYTFLVKFAHFIVEACADIESLNFDEREKLLDDVLRTAKNRMAVLVRQVTPSLTHAVSAVMLRLIGSIVSECYFKYKSVGEMVAQYPFFSDRDDKEKQNLLQTANWMTLLFRIIPARKNKGVAMDIVPKLVEGNSANYVTGGGQTKQTADRVQIYEREGECIATKRVRRKPTTASTVGTMTMEKAQLMLDAMRQCYYMAPMQHQFGALANNFVRIPTDGSGFDEMCFNHPERFPNSYRELNGAQRKPCKDAGEHAIFATTHGSHPQVQPRQVSLHRTSSSPEIPVASKRKSNSLSQSPFNASESKMQRTADYSFPSDDSDSSVEYDWGVDGIDMDAEDLIDLLLEYQ